MTSTIAKLSPRCAKIKKWLYTLDGGPYAFKEVWLTTAGTLPIVVGKWYGYYDRNNQWIPL